MRHNQTKYPHKLLFLNHLQYEKYSIKVLQLIVKINRINRDAMYAHI